MRGVYITYKAQQLENDILYDRLARDGGTADRPGSALDALKRLILTLTARQ